MATQSDKTKRELVKLAREQSDVLAFADRHREIEVLPEGLETNYLAHRKRGNRTDRDCIDEICELIAQGITVMASVRYVGVPYATWHKWTKLNHEQAREKYEFAYTCHLEAMADRTLQIYEELKALRESEMSKFIATHDAWCAKVDALEKGEKTPREPVYRGPTEWESSLAEKRVSIRKWQLELRHAKFQRKQQIENTVRTDVTISHELNLKRDPREAMQEYLKLIDAQPISEK
jgi:Bacteriophage Sf6, terminase small subunit-like